MRWRPGFPTLYRRLGQNVRRCHDILWYSTVTEGLSIIHVMNRTTTFLFRLLFFVLESLITLSSGRKDDFPRDVTGVKLEEESVVFITSTLTWLAVHNILIS